MTNKYDVPSMWTAQMGAVVAKSAELAATAYDTSAGLAAMRAGYLQERAFWNQGGPVPAKVRTDQIPTSHGEVTVRTYYPVDAPVLPGIVYLHGGGFVVGSPDTHDRITRILAERTQAAVISVDYTLAPEAKYPQALEECVAVVEYLRANATRWGLDAADISLAGDSGGAHLSLATYLYLREEKQAHHQIRCLLLFYGNYGLRDSMSWRLFGGSWDGLTAEDYAYYLSLYLSSEEQLTSKYVDLLANDLTTQMPPCYLAAAELDPLRDDSRCLAAILEHAGITHRYEEFTGVIHAFLHNSLLLDAANDALEHAAAFYHEQADRPQNRMEL